MTGLAWVVAVGLTATPLTLDEVRAASKENLEAIRSQLEHERAQAQVTQARASIFPQVSATANVSEFVAGPQRVFTTAPSVQPDGTLVFQQRVVDTPSFARSNFSVGLQVNQLLYDGGRWWNAIAQAGAQEKAAAGQLAEQRLASELEAVRRFYELVRAQLTLQVLQTTVQRSQAQLERAKSLYQAARVQRRDVLDAEINLGNDRISVLRQQQSIEAAQIDLLRWIGRPATEVEAVAPAAIDAAQAPAAAPSLEAALQQAHAQRPLLKVMQEQRSAAQLAVELSRADYFPRVTANVNLGRSSPTADPFFTDLTKQNSVNAGVGLSWDLFNGFQTDAQVSRARVELQRNERERTQALLELDGELKRSVKALATQLEVATIAESNKRLAAAQLELEEVRYASGAGFPLDVRNAQLKMTQAELTQLTGRIDVEIARAAMRRLTGGPVEETTR